MLPETAEKIEFLGRFKSDIRARFDGDDREELRTRISRAIPRARSIVSGAGALKLATLSPPPAIGGLEVHNADPFNFILQSYYGMSMTPAVADMIEEAIGVLESPEYEKQLVAKSQVGTQIADSRRKSTSSVRAATNRSEVAGMPDLPEKVTLSWLVHNVPVSFWIWFLGLLGAAFLLGAQIGPIAAP